MINKEVASDIIRYGQGLAVFGLANPTTGFLTNESLNKIDKEEAKEFLLQSEYIVRELVKQVTASGATIHFKLYG